MINTIPVGIPAEMKKAAMQTLTGAVIQAGNLSTELSSSLLNAANKAFISGMQMAALICAIVMLGLAFLTVKQLRRVQTN